LFFDLAGAIYSGIASSGKFDPMMLTMLIWIVPGIVSYYCWHKRIKKDNIQKLFDMKKLSCFAMGYYPGLSFNAHAQSKTGADFFEGKVERTGYRHTLWRPEKAYILEKKDNGLAGTVVDGATGKELAKCSKVDVKDNEITLYYTVYGY
jgi:hypothetical protein